LLLANHQLVYRILFLPSGFSSSALQICYKN